VNDADAAGAELRPVLTSRQRQSLINQRAIGWMRGLQSMSIDVGHDPFLSAGDSEVIEARFYEHLRRGTRFERTLRTEELGAACEAIAGAAADTNRAIVAFCPTAEVLGAFISTSEAVLPKLEALAARAGYELGVMSLDAGHGLSLEQTRYTDAGAYVGAGLLRLRAWGAFIPVL